MAFQVGTRVDPRLGALDFSGFTNAANIRAQAMANLGQEIGGAIQQYSINKQKKNEQDMRYNTILPYTTNLFGTDDGEKMARQFSKNPELGSKIMELTSPYRALDAAIVPITISFKIDQDGEEYVRDLTLIVDENPSPLVFLRALSVSTVIAVPTNVA